MLYVSCFRIRKALKIWLFTLSCVVLASAVAAGGAANGAPEEVPPRERPEVSVWIKQADASKDKADTWIKAAKEGNPYVKFIAAQELGLLGDARAIPVLKQLEEEPRGGDDVPPYQGFAADARRRLEADVDWKQNIESKKTDEARIKAARPLLSSENHYVRLKAFKFLSGADAPESTVAAVLDVYPRVRDNSVLMETVALLWSHLSENWVAPYLERIRDTADDNEAYPLRGMAADALKEKDAKSRWAQSFEKAKTAAERKAAALRALTTASADDEPIKRRAIDYLITLDDEDLIPTWVQGLTVDERIRQKVLKMGRKAVPELLKVIGDREHTDRIFDALDLLAQIGDSRAIKPMAKLMLLPAETDGKAYEVRSMAGMRLSKFGKQAIPALVEVLSSDNEPAVLEALDALNAIGDSDAIPGVKACLLREKMKSNPSQLIVNIGERTIADLANKNSGGGRK